MVRSPIRYPGGKFKAMSQIFPLIPEDVEEWREPFFGGGSVTPVSYTHLTSGSMDMSMRYLKTAMKEFARGISSQDRMSVIQFNSPGKARVLLESVNLTDQSHLISYDTVIDKLEAYGCLLYTS